MGTRRLMEGEEKTGVGREQEREHLGRERKGSVAAGAVGQGRGGERECKLQWLETGGKGRGGKRKETGTRAGSWRERLRLARQRRAG